MKNAFRLVLLIACVSVCSLPSAYAGCEYSHWSRVEYYQYHIVCGPPSGPHGLRPCSDWWSLDGECFNACDGTSSCTGDTEERAGTQVNLAGSGSCPPICD